MAHLFPPRRTMKCPATNNVAALRHSAYIALASLHRQTCRGRGRNACGNREAAYCLWRLHGGHRRTDSPDRTGGEGPGLRPRAHQAVRVGRRIYASEDRKSVVQGKSVSVRVDLGCRRIPKKKKKTQKITI